MNAELAVMDYVRAEGYECYLAPPEDAPAEYVTVQRTGGSVELGIERPSVLVQCWAAAALRAEEMAHGLAAGIAGGALYNAAGVYRAEVAGLSYVPDPDARTPRYQLVVNMVCSPL